MNTTVQLDKCQWCGGQHTGVCGLVKALEYHSDGTLKRVEFHEPKKFLPQDLPQEPVWIKIGSGRITWTPPPTTTITYFNNSAPPTRVYGRIIGHPYGDRWIEHPAG